jgi:DNA-binding response OmpR family regulator
MLNATFKSSDIEVTSANTVAEGWRLAQSKNLDLYLLATRFSDGDGFDLCRRIHNLVPHKPILFYTGNARSADEQKGLAAGAVAYLVKPYFGDLKATILNHIERSKKSAAMISKISEPTVNYLKTVSF